MSYYLMLLVGAVLVNNFVLSRFLGCCPFLGVSKKLDTALGMSGAVVFVMTVAAAVTWCLDYWAICGVAQSWTLIKQLSSSSR